MEFEYKLIHQSHVSVITLKGRIGKDARELLEQCRKEIESVDAEVVILLFKDVPSVDPAVFREFTLIQQDIRKKNTQLYLIGLSNTIKNYLNERAIIRLNEVRNSLEEVLTSKL